MKKPGTIQLIIILLSASLLAACAQSTAPNTNPSLPTVNVPVSAPTLVPNAVSATPPTVTPIATVNSKSSAVSSTASNADACTLLTKDDVSKVFGQAVDTVTGKGLGGVCDYTAKNLSFSLTVIHSGGTKYVNDTRTKLGSSALDVPGLGDEGLYNVNSYTLFVRKGDSVYLITYYVSGVQLTDKDRLAKETALAQQLISRLK